MEPLSPRRIIAAAMVVSLATSLFVSLAMVRYLTGENPRDVVERIIKRVSDEESAPLSERVLRQDELVVSAVKRAAPAVVSMVATKDLPVLEQFFVNPFEGDPFLERFFGDGGLRVPQFRQRGTEKQEIGAGTGFIVSPDGFILTNKHVVADAAAEYTVFLSDGTKAPARVLARDPVQDLAVVKVERGGLATVSLGDSAQLEIGQTVIAIGNALGEFSNTVSVGVISGLHRSVVASGGAGGPEELQELIQTDAAINPGNSGGPLLNLRGEVIGINVAMARGAENIGFAIPIAKAKRDIESVRTVGKIIYPFLGIRYLMITKEIQEERKLPADYGALLVSRENEPAVIAGSPADQAGLKAGDIILEFDGERIDASRTLATLIQKHRVGDRVTLKILRGTATLNVSATLGERP